MGFSLGGALGGIATGGLSGLGADFFGGKGASWSSLTPGGALDTLMGKDSMREQNEFNLKMWNLQNEYNKPINQMKRYEEAGLNPLLIYNQGNPGNATSHPVSASPKESGASALAKVFSTVSAIKNMQAMNAQVDNMKAQNKLINTQAQGAAIKNMQDLYTYDWLKERGLSPFSGLLERNSFGLLGNPIVQKGTNALVNTVGGFVGKIIFDMLMSNRYVQESVFRGNIYDRHDRGL